MRNKLKLILIALLIPIVSAFVAFQIVESPKYVLKRALRLQHLPASLSNLRMGSDVWTDEVRCFCFNIEPKDFPELLAGRQYQRFTDFPKCEIRTIHISPSESFHAHTSYLWMTDDSHCEINTNKETNCVIAIFAVN